MIELVLFVAGTFAGLLMGMLPGMHVNNVLPLMPLAFAEPWLIVPMSMSYVFSSFFPSILLGAPDADTALSVMPGHRLAMMGKAWTALRLSFLGALLSSFVLVIMVFFLVAYLPEAYPVMKPIIPWVLAIAVVAMVFSGKWAFIVVLLSASLGVMTFLSDALLPLLTGFFGMSTVIMSFGRKEKVIQNLRYEKRLSTFSLIRASALASMLSSVFGLFPALSSGVAATAARLFGRMHAEDFLVLMGGVNASYMMLSLVAMPLIGITRSGSAVFLSASGADAFTMAGLCALSSVASFVACERAGKQMVRLYSRANPRLLSFLAALLLISVNAAALGAYGLAVLFASTSTGLLAQQLRVKRINCMAALIVPAVIVLW